MRRSPILDFDVLLDKLAKACREVYGERLISLLVFGSVGRGTPNPDSDIDLLLVVAGLPQGRVRRVREFFAVESRVRDAICRGQMWCFRR
ncbi:MAG: nucleotidyltransferase domain-containing protein [Acidobacteriota bacterium]